MVPSLRNMVGAVHHDNPLGSRHTNVVCRNSLHPLKKKGKLLTVPVSRFHAFTGSP
jgi:hypothetical protein